VPTPARWSLRGTWRVLVKELSAFGVVGGASFVIDLSVFQFLITQTEIGAVTSKLLAALVSTTTAFLGHRFWSFSHRSHTQLHRDYVRFAVVNGCTLLLSLAIVAFVRYPLGQEGALALQAANVTSIAIGTVIRFLVYRAWVFPARADDGTSAPAPL
jgi:putative flippase GtrA